jgi:hypothetical protein
LKGPFIIQERRYSTPIQRNRRFLREFRNKNYFSREITRRSRDYFSEALLWPDLHHIKIKEEQTRTSWHLITDAMRRDYSI